MPVSKRELLLCNSIALPLLPLLELLFLEFPVSQYWKHAGELFKGRLTAGLKPVGVDRFELGVDGTMVDIELELNS